MRSVSSRTASAVALLIAGPIALATVAMAAYLLALSAAGLSAPTRPRSAGPRSTRFAILVPAYNEAAVIARLLRSLDGQRYPRESRDVFVVADNCDDDTAAIARREGAIVYERHEPALRTKGHALAWLLERAKARGPYGAYVVFDADSEVSEDFLTCMDERLAAGAQVLQAHYRSLNPNASGLAALREAALASLHFLRPLGRARLNLSCGLKGNGMCFRAEVLDRFGWHATGLAEDVELHLALVRHHIRVDFVPEAIVRAEMPTTLAAARSQNLRWEAGRIATVRRDALPLLGQGIRERDAVAIDAAVEQLIPPLAVATSVGVAAAAVGLAAGSPVVALVAAAGAAGLVLHIVLGLVAVRAPLRLYRALVGAPAYVLWKLALYVRALAVSTHQPWVRTQRGGADTPERIG